MHILVLNGPNLNLLGIRETAIYGTKSHKDLVTFLKAVGKRHGIKTTVRQSNHEGRLIDWLHETLGERYDGVVLNAGAYSHTSYALQDAVKALDVPVVSVHLSAISEREPFRRHDIVADACLATFSGQGFTSYEQAILRIKETMSHER